MLWKINYLPIFLILIIFPCVLSAIMEVDNLKKSKLIDDTSKILCSFQTKTINIYFEHGTSMGYPVQILEQLNKCNTSYICLRSRFRTSPLAAIKDDGILMYLLIILHNDTQAIELSIIEKKSAAKHLSHVIIIIEESQNITDYWLRRMFKKFYYIWFPNVVIMFWRHGRLQIYRYNYYGEEFLIKMDYADMLPKRNELFPKHLPNMHGKVLRICLYSDELRAIIRENGRLGGSDGLLAKFVAESLNATRYIHHVSTYGYENRTSDICFKEIRTGLDDMALNIRFQSLETFTRKVESTVVHTRDDLCVLVPKAKIASTFWNLFRSYSNFVWFLILISLLLAYGFCITFYEAFCFKPGFLLHLIGGIIALPFHVLPLRFSLRLFLFAWFVYGMLICGAFKCTLTSNLVFRKYLPDINTLEDLALSPYDLLIFPRHLKHMERYLNSSNHYQALIKDKIKIVPDMLLHRYIESNNNSYAYLQKFHVAKFHANARRHTRYGRPIYHVMDTCLVPFHAVFIVPYGSPYLGALNSLIRSSHEFGFVLHWQRIMEAYFFQSTKLALKRERNDDDPVVLRLRHFQAAFSFWAFGLFLACLVFLKEKYQYQQQNQLTCFFRKKQTFGKNKRIVKKLQQKRNINPKHAKKK